MALPRPWKGSFLRRTEGLGGRGEGKNRAKQGRAFLSRDWNSMDAQRILGPLRLVTHDVRLMSNSLSVQKPDAVTKNIFPSLISNKWSLVPQTGVFAECPCPWAASEGGRMGAGEVFSKLSALLKSRRDRRSAQGNHTLSHIPCKDDQFLTNASITKNLSSTLNPILKTRLSNCCIMGKILPHTVLNTCKY